MYRPLQSEVGSWEVQRKVYNIIILYYISMVIQFIHLKQRLIIAIENNNELSSETTIGLQVMFFLLQPIYDNMEINKNKTNNSYCAIRFQVVRVFFQKYCSESKNCFQVIYRRVKNSHLERPRRHGKNRNIFTDRKCSPKKKTPHIFVKRMYIASSSSVFKKRDKGYTYFRLDHFIQLFIQYLFLCFLFGIIKNV